MTGKFVTERAAKGQQEEDHQGPLVAKPKVQEAGAEEPIVDMPPGWNSLVLDVLQESSQQLLFALVMPGVEPYGTVAGLFEVATEQRHNRALAFTPFAFDGDRDGRLGLGIADEPRESQSHGSKVERIHITGLEGGIGNGPVGDRELCWRGRRRCSHHRGTSHNQQKGK